MKKKDRKPDEFEMREEYDFSGAVRGKHNRAYRSGHTVRIHKADGEMEVHYFTLEDGAVMLDPDVKTHFRSSQAVNNALREAIAHR